MKRKSNSTKVLIILLLTALTITFAYLILRKQHQLKIELTNVYQRKEVTDKNTADSIENVLLTVFKAGDALNTDEYYKKYYYNVVACFKREGADTVSQLSYWNYWQHITYELEENKNNENMNTTIKLEKIYDLGNRNYETTFFVERKLNHKNDSAVIKIKDHYYVKFDYSTNKLLIVELYNIDDFNHYLKRHNIASCIYTTTELRHKYQNFKKSLYHDLDERYIHKDWFEEHGYKI